MGKSGCELLCNVPVDVDMDCMGGISIAMDVDIDGIASAAMYTASS